MMGREEPLSTIVLSSSLLVLLSLARCRLLVGRVPDAARLGFIVS